MLVYLPTGYGPWIHTRFPATMLTPSSYRRADFPAYLWEPNRSPSLWLSFGENEIPCHWLPSCSRWARRAHPTCSWRQSAYVGGRTGGREDRILKKRKRHMHRVLKHGYIELESGSCSVCHGRHRRRHHATERPKLFSTISFSHRSSRCELTA